MYVSTYLTLYPNSFILFIISLKSLIGSFIVIEFKLKGPLNVDILPFLSLTFLTFYDFVDFPVFADFIDFTKLLLLVIALSLEVVS